jgi:hypothetical protein
LDGLSGGVILIVGLDYPLRSSLGISPTAFEVLQTTLIDAK